MHILQKDIVSKLIELYRSEHYKKTNDALFSKTKFGYALHNSTRITICSFHTYQKMLNYPTSIKDQVYLQLLNKLGLRYRESSINYVKCHIDEIHSLYDAFLFYDLTKVEEIINQLLTTLSLEYVIENEYIDLFQTIIHFYIKQNIIEKAKLIHLLNISFLFTDELNIILYDLCFRSFFGQHSDFKKCEELIKEIKQSNIKSTILDYISLMFSSYNNKNKSYINEINLLIKTYCKMKNYTRTLDLYTLKLDYIHSKHEDDTLIYDEVNSLINSKPIHPRMKLIWTINEIIHSYDFNNYIQVKSLFIYNMNNYKAPILIILLYYSSSHVLNQTYKIIDNDFISDKKPEVYYSLKEYFESDLTIREREKKLLSFYKEIPYNDSILNKIIYNEFMLYYNQFSKSTLIQFIKENDRRIK